MKNLITLIALLAISANLLTADSPPKTESFQDSIQKAVTKRDKSALLALFNFAGINATTRKSIDKEIEEILSSRILDASVTALDEKNRKLAIEDPAGVNGTPEYLVSIVPTNDRRALHFVAGKTTMGTLILLSNREE